MYTYAYVSIPSSRIIDPIYSGVSINWSSMMTQEKPTLGGITVKTIITHTVTYFIMGLLASTLFDYGGLYAGTSLNQLMRQTNDPLVMAGPLFQPLRGLLFGWVFFLLREVFFGPKNGWLVMWITLVVIGVLSPFGPPPGSIEGMIYTIIPLKIQLIGLPEVLLQALTFSLIVTYWVNHPERKWLSWVLGIAFGLVVVLPVMGLVFG
jgi:hypothetical protein